MALKFVGQEIASAVIGLVVEKVPSVLNYFKGKKLNDESLQKLKIMLISANAVLIDAEVKEITNPAVKERLDELKDAVYDAEDLFDEIATEALRCKIEAESQTGKRKYSDFVNSFDEGLESDLEKILHKLEYITQQKDVLGLKDVAGEVPLPSSRLTTSCPEKCVYGRDLDREVIFKMLQSDDAGGDEICVVPIVGMGGIGKTTLARLLYNDSRVNETFDLKAWVCVSENFDSFKILKTILEGVTKKTCDFQSLDLLQSEIRDALKGKKLFLILDDVWNENYNDWEELLNVFKCGAQKIKIIVTTRNENVASKVCTTPTQHHCLKGLSNDECWVLFTQHAFGNRESCEFPHLEAIGKEIVQKCRGLPLTIKTIGGSLRSNLDLTHWEKILKNHLWDLPEAKSNILPALRLSYYYLPSHLKRCFAYCSIFPKNYELEKDKLILLWMAEDLLQKPKEDESMEFEEIGKEYFNDLVSRSFFQRTNKYESYFVMHDLISDLAKSISGEFCVRPKNYESKEITRKTRHLSYYEAEFDASKNLEIPNEAKGLRTLLGYLLVYWQHECDNIGKMVDELLKTFKCLRVLSLYCIDELPDSVGDLKHLRYLDIGDTEIKHLPDSLCSLYNLQTLILPRCITKLPTHMCKLINLRHLDNSRTNLEEMPPQMGKLKNLRKLPIFFVGKNGGSNNTRELGQLLWQLSGKLIILNLENVHCTKDDTKVMLKDKQDLSELELKWKDDHDTDDSEKERNVLEQLCPPKNLKSLTIVNYVGTKFPNWLEDPSFRNMVSIVLQGCKNCFFCPPLGQLPYLKKLEIEGFTGEKVGPEFYGNDSSAIEPRFRSLEYLSFGNMQEWQEWVIFDGEVFPCLQELYIYDCPKLSGGLPNELPSLTKLVIRWCKQLVASLPKAPALVTLTLLGCPELESFPEEGLPSNLERLDILYCNKLFSRRREWRWDSLRRLREFIVRSDCEESGNFPDEAWLPSTLTHFKILSFRNLKSLNGKGFQNLTSLKSLELVFCDEHQRLPEEGLPTSLSQLRISGCPLLEKRCEEEKGEDWDKIAGIRYVKIAANKKVVLKVELHDDRSKQEAMKSVSRLSGVDSITTDMKDKKLTVTGDIDPVDVVSKLRKLCHSEILSVGPAKE